MKEDGVGTSGRELHVVRAVLHKEIVMGTTRSTVGVQKYPLVVDFKDTGGTIPVDINTVRIILRNTTQVWTSTGPSVPSIGIRIQNIEAPRRSIIPQEVRIANQLYASINIIPAKYSNSYAKLE